MSFIEATLICDGAVEQTQIFEADERLALEEWLTAEKHVAQSAFGANVTEIHLLEHGHDNDGEECSCPHYVDGNKPYWFHKKLSDLDEEIRENQE